MSEPTDTVQDLAQRAMVLCMEISRRGLASAFCSYSGHIDNVTVYVHPLGYAYTSKEEMPHRIVDAWIPLLRDDPTGNLCGAVEQLEAILAAGQVIHINDLRGAA